MTVTPKTYNNQSAASSYNTNSPRSCPVQMDELDGLRLKVNPEDSASELINLEDDHYTVLQRDLESDAKDLEADSWSVTVDQNYLKALHKEAVKRQDVIYELIQTEMNHVRTLKILLHVYMHELRRSLLIEDVRMERLFPVVDFLLSIHQHFLNKLKKRCNQCREEGNPNNYQIAQLGDILINQFSGDLGERLKEYYGFFCSHHNEAVSCYKEQQQNNKKLQSLMKKIGQLPLVRRLGIPECFLLVTQRITKYPVLVERIIQNTEAETGEHESLVQALGLIKDTISQVDAEVNEYEKAARLREIGQRLEPKSQGRLKDGRVFRREFLIDGTSTLLHEGAVAWKALSGRNKDIHAVLLSEVLLLLQEKDQKFIFASVDNKPPVISLQKLIVREVAHEDKAMFLICATSSMPEMYEIHTSSREERNTWMNLIWEAVNNYPEEEEELYNEQIPFLQECQKNLMMRDTQIVQSLTEKLQIFSALSETVTGQPVPYTRLLLRGDATDLQQGERLLKGAIDEVESLQNLLLLRLKDSHVIGENQVLGIETVNSTSSASVMRNGDAAVGPAIRDIRPEDGADSQLQGIVYSESLEQSADGEIPVPDSDSPSEPFPEAEVYDRVVMLAQRLYSLQAIIAQQDSQIELQRVLLEKSKKPARNCSNMLLEQEKQRNLEKQKEELANFHRLQAQHREEQQRWEKERERQRIQAEALEAQLLQREEECRKLEEKLEEEKLELRRQREAYQVDLKTLKDARQKVEKERERVEQQQEKIKRHKSMMNPGHYNPGHYDEPPHYSAPSSDFNQSFRGLTGVRRGNLVLTPQPYVRPSIPAATNPEEIPPTVPPRKESINPQPININLISTTNQAYKSGAVQQQIPTKLALSKGKEKSSKAKGHQRSHSAASIDVTQEVIPIRITGNEGGSLRAKKSASPQTIHRTNPFNPPGFVYSVRATQSFSTNRRNSADSPPLPPPFPKEVLKKDPEHIVYL